MHHRTSICKRKKDDLESSRMENFVKPDNPTAVVTKKSLLMKSSLVCLSSKALLKSNKFSKKQIYPSKPE